MHNVIVQIGPFPHDRPAAVRYKCVYHDVGLICRHCPAVPRWRKKVHLSLARAIHRAVVDPRFCTAVQSDPNGTLKEESLSLNADEIQALLEVVQQLQTQQGAALIQEIPCAVTWGGGAALTAVAFCK
jgi:hypothetical protein